MLAFSQVNTEMVNLLHTGLLTTWSPSCSAETRRSLRTPWSNPVACLTAAGPPCKYLPTLTLFLRQCVAVRDRWLRVLTAEP